MSKGKTLSLKAAAVVATTLVSSPATAESPAQPVLDQSGHVVQFVRFESKLSRDAVLAAAQERKPGFAAMPGLVQKYYLELDEPNTYGGIYIWESKAAMAAFTKTNIFRSIPAAYGIASAPQVEIIPVLFPLR